MHIHALQNAARSGGCEPGFLLRRARVSPGFLAHTPKLLYPGGSRGVSPLHEREVWRRAWRHGGFEGPQALTDFAIFDSSAH